MEIYDINRKHTLDKKYFRSINTKEKAYWLGFLWADGYIGKSAKRSKGNNRITISQHIKEREHIAKLKKELCCDYELKTYKNTICLQINCRPMCEDLENIGFGTKEQRTKLPNLRKEFIPDFIRGYFDGDGCLSVYIQNIKKWHIQRQELSFTGNENLLNEIQKYLESEIKTLSHTKMKTYKRTTKAVSLRYGKKEDVINICELMYNQSKIHLMSKYKKYKILITGPIGRQPNALRIQSKQS